jgi:ABC-type long-subunit fatty acid transport system fused permease/ATPase subunit
MGDLSEQQTKIYSSAGYPSHQNCVETEILYSALKKIYIYINVCTNISEPYFLDYTCQKWQNQECLKTCYVTMLIYTQTVSYKICAHIQNLPSCQLLHTVLMCNDPSILFNAEPLNWSPKIMKQTTAKI